MTERGQFRALYRNFLLRLVDLEILSAHGDILKLFAQPGGLLGAFGLLLALQELGLRELTAGKLAMGAWGDQEFLISTTMAVAGMFTVLAWDSVFPDRRDSLILSLLPLRARIVFQAKLAAMGTGLGVSVVALNAAPGAIYPFVAAMPQWGISAAPRAALAYWITMAAAGLFVFCAMLAAQGLAAQLLNYRLFPRVSNLLQLAAFFLVLAVYFLAPGPTDFSITDPNYAWLIRRLPSFWFLGLFQELSGAALPVAASLAERALWALATAVGAAAATYALAYKRNIRRLIEQPDIAPADRSRPATRLAALLARKLALKPLERAVVLFTARTLARSRPHRNLLAAYGGLGLAISLAYLRSLLYGGSQMYAIARRYGFRPPSWNEPNAPLMTAAFVMLFFAVIGTRAVFSLPATLKANWIFRITAVHSPKAYFAAVRKSLYAVVAWPVAIALASVYLAFWPRVPALGHAAVMALASVILVERSLFEFRKIPFTCSYLPGQANLRLKLGAYGSGFLFLSYAAGAAENSLLETPARAVVLFAALLALLIRSRKRWAAFATSPYERLQFEAVETAEVSPLDLSHDVYSREERYIDVLHTPPEPTAAQRVKTFVTRTAIVTLSAMAVGAIYEQVSEWLHPPPPRIGRRVDIGGRSLNILCSGRGGPAVIFESGAGGPGYGWVHIQRQVAAFAQACWYDRAGYGWSDSGPYPRDSAAIAEDLHRLLRNAGVAPPYVLVGASFGGLNVRVYTQHYPAEVAGMVLVDSSHADEGMPILPFGDGWLPYFPHLMSMFIQVMKHVGVMRLIMDRPDTSAIPASVTPEEYRITQSFEPRTLAENGKELYYESFLEARAAGGLGDRPLIVLTAGLPGARPNGPVQAREMLARQANWIEIQGQLARLSTRGKQIVLRDSRHAIQWDRPDAVIGAVREVVAELRAHGTD